MAKRSARARSIAAKRGWETRRARALTSQVKHGLQARQKTESRLTPAQKAARTRAANRLTRQLQHERRSESARRGWETRRARERRGIGGGGGRGGGGRREREIDLDSLDDYPDDDFDEWDIETSPDYEEN